MAGRTRKPIPVSIQLQVFVRDHWLCHVCRRPIILPLAIKLLDELVGRAGLPNPRAYYHPNWRRDRAPLLDELGACVDHVEAFAKQGPDDLTNFAAICSRCNTRKATRTRNAFIAASKPWRVRGKHGEPRDWDGLAAVFVALAPTVGRSLTPTERTWLTALRGLLAQSAR